MRQLLVLTGRLGVGGGAIIEVQQLVESTSGIGLRGQPVSTPAIDHASIDEEAGQGDVQPLGVTFQVGGDLREREGGMRKYFIHGCFSLFCNPNL
jgi:hypothetical protein